MDLKKEKNDFLIICIWGILLSYLTYVFVLRELEQEMTDYYGHVFVYLPLFNKETWGEGWMAVPYCMWHLVTMFFNRILLIPIEISAAYTGCIFTLFSYLVLYWMFQKITEYAGCRDSSARSCTIAFGMCLVQPLYFHWLDAGAKYIGTFSMNPIHNPTYMCARGFGLVCLCLVSDIWGYQKSKKYRGIFFRVENGLKRYYIYLSIILFLSAMAKPTFAEMFIPAVAFLMLWELLVRLMKKDGSAALYFKHCLMTFVCALPTLLYILMQFLAYFIWGGSYGDGGSLIVTHWLEVWRMFTQNVGLSIVLAMAFPLFMVLINVNYFVKSDLGRLALMGYGIGFFEAALLGEAGGKMDHADFMWPMMSGMLLMYVVSMMRLLILERTQADTRGKRILLAIGWFLFVIHVLYGILYIMQM